ncbi:redoxin domain-containing protein [filamentous cyanobacterium LEGE 11480]|uniref:Redoxin domain-containing protein n=1 Tax=Romeriopsis navalis LEGE 11480 TaxID=2777977 RepID=A0A928VMP8_9CYAN|nr:thioredoxin-like domain-containing protein [Romeriopsis navalis]MBE9029227.1 redoxin domain-containing protein [Romeriopsis navalis LEGE 11480]
MPRIRAPEFPTNFDWLNSHPLKLRDLQGHYVLLDFWTHGCINCIHVLPKIHQLAQQFPNLTIIGIHSGKFAQEQQLNSVQAAIAKHQVEHPIICDQQQTIWQSYTIRAYPTFVLIDPQGYIVLSRSGESGFAAVAAAIDQQLTAVEIPPTAVAPASDSPLYFPGKVLAIADQLCIADSGHHRIIMSQIDGSQPQTIGNGQLGLIDGDYFQAQFNQPQGLAYDRAQQILYIADTGNHAIRQVDLWAQQVTTIAGNGTQSPTIYPYGGRAKEIPLNSPWDLVLIDRRLLIAMAGSHQIWQMDLDTERIETFAGSGAEGCFDGSPEIVAFAQPSGLATDGHSLFVADCESSSIRQIDLTSGITSTICGNGNLYTFGDRDGRGESVQLQHPMGLTYADGALWIADTYNQKIKRFDCQTRACCTIATGFAEPTGITANQHNLLIANTNQHQIQQLPSNGGHPDSIEFPGLCPPGICFR